MALTYMALTYIVNRYCKLCIKLKKKLRFTHLFEASMNFENENLLTDHY